MYFKTPDPKSTKKSHKKTNSTSKKPKLKLKQCSIVHFYRLYERNQSNTKIININSKTKHEIILNIRHIFTYLTNNNKDVIIAWVPSHQGIKGNEEADIAKEATPPSSDVIRRRIPYQDLVVTLHHAEKLSWNKIWNTSKKKQKLI